MESHKEQSGNQIATGLIFGHSREILSWMKERSDCVAGGNDSIQQIDWLEIV